ncbi:MAG: hypothetical protein GQ564_11685 [Bacteroidales bacterium]|nr:hypothetical protein [Bacteroidales bacterium]
MDQFLYILKHTNNESFKVGITNNLKNRLNKIENDFGKIKQEDSKIFSCPNRKLLENIEHGIHAFLNNYFYSPKSLGGGSTEWFKMEAFEKGIEFIHMYVNELNEFNLEGNILIVLNRPTDFKKSFSEIGDSKQFLDIHSKTVDAISEFISYNKDKLIFTKRAGEFCISNIDLTGLKIGKLPRFQWVKIRNNELIFDIQVYNEWEKSREQEAIRGLVEIKYFSNFTWNNYKSMF